MTSHQLEQFRLVVSQAPRQQLVAFGIRDQAVVACLAAVGARHIRLIVLRQAVAASCATDDLAGLLRTATYLDFPVGGLVVVGNGRPSIRSHKRQTQDSGTWFPWVPQPSA